MEKIEFDAMVDVLLEKALNFITLHQYEGVWYLDLDQRFGLKKDEVVHVTLSPAGEQEPTVAEKLLAVNRVFKMINELPPEERRKFCDSLRKAGTQEPDWKGMWEDVKIQICPYSTWIRDMMKGIEAKHTPKEKP